MLVFVESVLDNPSIVTILLIALMMFALNLEVFAPTTFNRTSVILTISVSQSMM
jgi:hypothetical protein